MGIRESCIIHINPTQNKYSDSLAKFARREGRNMTLDWFVPLEVVELATVDCMNLLKSNF